MTFRECGLGSLPELLVMLFLVGLLSYAVAYLWLIVLDDFFGDGEIPNMAALHTLNLIIGFLYVGLIRQSREQWVATMKTANRVMLTTHSMVLEAQGQGELQRVITKIQELRNHLVLFYRHTSSSHLERIAIMLCCARKRVSKQVEQCLNLRQKMHSLQMVIPETNSRLRGLYAGLENTVADIENRYFSKEPACFRWHLNLLLIVYFAVLPVQLYSAYSETVVLVLYPIIIYFLFSVAILTNVYDSPVEHPELNECFETLNKRLMQDVSTASGGTYLRTLKVY